MHHSLSNRVQLCGNTPTGTLTCNSIHYCTVLVNEKWLSCFYLAFIISRATPCLSYSWHCPVCFMAKGTVLQSQFVQPKRLYPIMKPLKMLGCYQMACRWGEGEQASLATSEACTPVMPLKVVVMLFWKQYTREIWSDAWMELFWHACPRSIFFICSFMWE